MKKRKIKLLILLAAVFLTAVWFFFLNKQIYLSLEFVFLFICAFVFGAAPQIKAEVEVSKIRRDFIRNFENLEKRQTDLMGEFYELEKTVKGLKSEIARLDKLYEISTDLEKIKQPDQLARVSLEAFSLRLGCEEAAFFRKEEDYLLVASRNVPAEKISVWKSVASGARRKGFSRLPLKVGRELGAVVLKHPSGGIDSSGASVIASQVALGYEKTLLYERVEKLSRVDGLTKLYLRRYFMERLKEELSRAERYNYRVAFAIFDIDDFKKYNDTYGHQMGDKILEKVGRIVKESLEKSDFAGRYGGEEFCIFMPLSHTENARARIESMREKIERDTKVTVSVGISYFPSDATTLKDLIDTADEALYRAKSAGKNRVEEYAK